MKKLLKMGICIMMAAVVLSGWGGGNSKTETAVYEGEINGVKVSNTIDYSGDRVLKQTSVSEMNFKDLGITKDLMEQTVAQYKKLYDIKGVTYKADITDDTISETTVIDYENADFDALKTAKLITSTKEDGKILYVSYEQTVKNLESSGLTKK